MTTRILLVPLKVTVELVKLELRIVRGVARLAYDLGRDSTHEEPLADVVPEPPPPAAADEEPAAAPTTRGASRSRGATSPRSPAARTPAARKPAASRRAASPRRAAAAPETESAAAEPGAPEPGPEPAPPEPATPATETAAPAAAAAAPDAAAPAAPPRDEPTPGEIAAAREARREAEVEHPTASVGPAAHAGPEIHVDPPWEGYDGMALDEVLGRLQDADQATLAAVRMYESTHESRQAILLATETP